MSETTKPQIPLLADEEWPESRLYVSAAYRVGEGWRNGHHPHRIAVWDNTARPNPRNGEPVRYNDFGPVDGGEGQWLSPENRATDDVLTVLATAQAVVIDGRTANYGPFDDVLEHGQTVTLVFPDGRKRDYVIRGRNASLRDPILTPADHEEEGESV